MLIINQFSFFMHQWLNRSKFVPLLPQRLLLLVWKNKYLFGDKQFTDCFIPYIKYGHMAKKKKVFFFNFFLFSLNLLVFAWMNTNINTKFRFTNNIIVMSVRHTSSSSCKFIKTEKKTQSVTKNFAFHYICQIAKNRS